MNLYVIIAVSESCPLQINFSGFDIMMNVMMKLKKKKKINK